MIRSTFAGGQYIKKGGFRHSRNRLRWYLDSSKVNHAENPFLPDALYVLGRTYEAYGQPSAASYYYQQCIRTKSAKGTPFPAKAKAGLARIKEMLQDEYRTGGPRPADTATASGTASLIDPFSQKPIPPEQYARLKKFMALVAKKAPLPSALRSLTPADRKLELVTRLVVMYEEAAKKSPATTPGKKKDPPPGKSKTR